MLKNTLQKYFKILLASILFLALFAIGSTEQKLIATTQAVDNNFTLTWSSNSYVPPGYEGLALPTMRSQIKVFVLPTKKLDIDPERLIYRWILDKEVISGAGGQGKSIFSFRAKKWPSDYHSVESQILDGENVIWRGLVEIKISSSQAIFKLPNDNYTIPEMFSAKTGQTLKILAIPFFFNTKDPNSLKFQWKLDGQEITNSDDKDFSIFSLTIPEGQISNALIRNLKLLVSDKNDSDQQASSQITLKIQ